MTVMMIDWRQDAPGGQQRDSGTDTYDGKQLATTANAAPAESHRNETTSGTRFENRLLILIPPPLRGDSGTEHREIAWDKGSDP